MTFTAGREQKIHVLDFEVANLIAAGEVVDRPASVIKELVENSIDSGATVITVEIRRGGIAYMRVSDNGCGIGFDDLPTAILRHATSKIKDAGDLDKIGTLGFRGEALAAIASVSRLRIISRPKDEELGGLLHAIGGEIIEHNETGCSAGTTVIVEELFANVPARHKFLKKDNAEAAAVATVVERIALSRPDISFRFISNGEMKLRTEGNGDLAGAIYSVLGRDFQTRTIKVEYKNAGLTVSGFIGMPDTARANRSGEIFFINGRLVRSKTAGAAVEQAYSTYIPGDRFPACVLSLEIAPDTVDVNVHPAKLEVKFSNEKLVFETFYYAVRPALERYMTREELPLGDKTDDANREYMRRAAAAASSFVPVGDRKRKPKTITIDTGNDNVIVGGTNPHMRTEIDFSQSRGGHESDIRLVRAIADAMPANPDTPASGSTQSRTSENPPAQRQNEPAHGSNQGIAPESPSGSDQGHTKSASGSDQGLTPESHAAPAQILAPDSTAAPTHETAVDGQTAPAAFTTAPGERVSVPVPEYTILGEAWDCYVIVLLGEKIILIDKHAAHERILFEQLRRAMREDPASSASQLLLVPVTVRLTETEAANVADFADDIRAAGFDFTLDGTTAYVTAVPSGFTAAMTVPMFETFGSELSTSARDARDEVFERALYRAACKAAVKGGKVYDSAHIKWICDELFRLPDIKYCPHGRPVALEISHAQLDRRFGRTE